MLTLATLVGITPGPLDACSKRTFSEVQPRFYFTFTALPDTVDAGWSGALRFDGQPLDRLDEMAAEGPRWAQLLRLEDVGGVAAETLPDHAEHLVLVPWGYGADCRPIPWQHSARLLEPGERGLMHAALREREHWVAGVPTADFHLPYSQPFPRHARHVLGPLMSIEDAFRVHDLLPRPEELERDGAGAVEPLLEWARRNPDLARQSPARDAIVFNLRRVTNEEVRRREVPIAGTYRFVLDLGDGVPRTFYARTSSTPSRPTAVESGEGWVEELRPPWYGGYTLWADSGSDPELLGAGAGNPGGYLYVFIGDEERGDASARRIRGAAELALATRALRDDPDVRALEGVLHGGGRLGEYVERNLRPGTGGFFLLHPDGAVTFEQTQELPDGRIVTLEGVRIRPTAR